MVDISEDSRGNQGKLLACVADEEVVREHAQWWNPDLRASWGATRTSAVEGMDSAISALTADECNCRN